MRAMRTVRSWMSLRRSGQVSADVGRVRTDVLPESPDAGSTFLAPAVDSRADLGAKCADVTTRFVPMHHDQRGADGVYNQGCDEFCRQGWLQGGGPGPGGRFGLGPSLGNGFALAARATGRDWTPGGVRSWHVSGQAASSRRSRPEKTPSMTPSTRDMRSVSAWTSLRRAATSPRTSSRKV